jgi:soluble lytic murein transglycosylase-like protein
MRSAALSIAILFAVTAADAQVRLSVSKDGRKVISNFGSSSAQRSNYTWLAKQRNRRTKYDAMIDRYALQFGVDPVLVRAVIQVESDFDPRCVSNKGARGLMQLMPETARRYSVASIFDPEQNIRGGVHYLSDLLHMFNEDLPRTLAAYNAGENAVLKYAGIPPYGETTTYVKRAMTVYYGREYGAAEWFAAGKSAKLKGGFGHGLVQPLAATMLPGLHYLGTTR